MTLKWQMLIGSIVNICFVLLFLSSCSSSKKITETIDVAEFEVIEQIETLNVQSSRSKTSDSISEEKFRQQLLNLAFKINYSAKDSGVLNLKLGGLDLNFKKTGSGNLEITGTTEVREFENTNKLKSINFENLQSELKKSQKETKERQKQIDSERLTQEDSNKSWLPKFLKYFITKWWFWLIIILAILRIVFKAWFKTILPF